MFKTIKNDLPASIVVFFVALPLCLGIALASGAPLFSGLIAGIVGGIVVGSLSGSKIGVSGPAAGLAAIVLSAIGSLGSYENFLVAVVLGGMIQLIFGFLRAGIIGYYFPSAVIKGMLTGIGIIITLKQIPHFFGYNSSGENFSLFRVDDESVFSGIIQSINSVSLGSTIIGITGLATLIFWEKVLAKKAKIFQLIQGPLVAVVIGIVFFVLTQGNSYLAIDRSLLVNVPIPESTASFLNQFSFPNFAVIARADIWIVAFTIALVASLETLLCVEATDKLDPEKNITPTNRELLAQGTGNILSGMIGGLPITQVIVRSSANIQSGGKSKASAIIHGFFLLISVLLIPTLLNKIPLSILASILLVVGYKLAKPALFAKMYSLGWNQFIPFTVTVAGIVFVDLLWGIGMGLIIGIAVILIKSFQNSHSMEVEQGNAPSKITMTLAEEVTFFNKARILKELNHLPNDALLELDIRKTQYLDNDIVEILDDFVPKAREKNIHIKWITKQGVQENPLSFSATL